MAEVSGLTAPRMLEIEGASVVDGEVVGDDLILERFNGSTINAGNVRGPQGPAGSSYTPPLGAGQVSRFYKDAQSIPHNSETLVDWGSQRPAPYYDYTNWFTMSSNVLTLKSGVDGVYDITAFIYWASAGAGTRRIIAIEWAAASGQSFYKLMRNDGIAKATAAAASGVQVTVTVPLVAGNQIRVVAYQDTGAALSLSAMSVFGGGSAGFWDLSRRV